MWSSRTAGSGNGVAAAAAGRAGTSGSGGPRHLTAMSDRACGPRLQPGIADEHVAAQRRVHDRCGIGRGQWCHRRLPGAVQPAHRRPHVAYFLGLCLITGPVGAAATVMPPRCAGPFHQDVTRRPSHEQRPDVRVGLLGHRRQTGRCRHQTARQPRRSPPTTPRASLFANCSSPTTRWPWRRRPAPSTTVWATRPRNAGSPATATAAPFCPNEEGGLRR